MTATTERFFGQSLSGHDVERRLRSALRLPSQSRSVAEWLFDVHENNFRVDSSTVSPECFATALAVVYAYNFYVGCCELGWGFAQADDVLLYAFRRIRL